MFYPNWDEAACRHYLEVFSLDADKRLTELSEGMKVKFNLMLALSHHAELLILDEPTSGLDPISREELLETLMDLAGQGVAILFPPISPPIWTDARMLLPIFKKGRL